MICPSETKGSTLTRMMDPHAQLEDLKSVAQKLSIEIEIKNLQDEEFPIQSGYCKVNGKRLILMDKKLAPEDQIRILMETLQKFDLESIYVPNWIRETLEKTPLPDTTS